MQHQDTPTGLMLVDKLAHRFEPADSWQPPSLAGADIIDYYRSSLDGARMAYVKVDGQHLHYRVADLAVVVDPDARLRAEFDRAVEAAMDAAIVKAAQVRAAHADRAYDVACREYCSRHLGTAIRASKEEKQYIRKLHGDALEAELAAREITEELA